MRLQFSSKHATDRSDASSKSVPHIRRMKPTIAIVTALVAIASFSAACEPWTPHYFTDIGSATGDAPLRYRDGVFPNITRTNSIQWGSAPNLSTPPVEVPLLLDMYEPTGDTATARPAIVIAHSGGFFTYTRRNGNSEDLAKRFAAKGYVAISIDYRLLSSVDCGQYFAANQAMCGKATMAATSDAQAAVRWLRANAATYRIDVNRIAMTGDSAGAVMSGLVGILADVADNPTDPLSVAIMQGAPPNVGNPGYSSEIQAWSSLSGGLPPAYTTGLAEQLKAAPTKPAPGYLFSGTKDTATPYAWSTAFRDELVKANVYSAFMGIEGAGHVPYGNGDVFNSQSANWFYAFLDLPEAQQTLPPAT